MVGINAIKTGFFYTVAKWYGLESPVAGERFDNWVELLIRVREFFPEAFLSTCLERDSVERDIAVPRYDNGRRVSVVILGVGRESAWGYCWPDEVAL